MKNILLVILCAFITIATGFASAGLFNKSLPAIIPDTCPPVEGVVQELVGDTTLVGQASIFMLRTAKVDFEWQGKNYTATDPGYNFTEPQYKQALETKRCTVYVNREQPELSLLSTQVPFGQLFFCGLFGLISLGMAYITIRKMCRIAKA